MAAPNATGDKPRKDFKTLAASVEIPVIIGTSAKDVLGKTKDNINQAAYGKRQGAMVAIFKSDKTLVGVAVASGSAQADKWYMLNPGTAADTDVVTPTA